VRIRQACLGLFLASAAVVAGPAVTANATGSVSLIARPVSAHAGKLLTVQYRVNRAAYCQLRAHQGTHSTVGPTWRISQRLAAFTWRMPSRARSGTWALVLRCGRTRATASKATFGHAVANVTVHGTRPGVVRFPSTIKVAQSSLRDPGVSAGLGAGSLPPFGTVLVRGSDWLGGAGVNVISNGVWGCYQGCTARTSYGIAYQCVELVNRFLGSKGWSPLIGGNANRIYANASTQYLDKHPNNSGYIPVPGDVIVWNGTYGHVGVVEWVGGGRIGWVEQNASPNGRMSTTLSGSGALGSSYSGLTPIGFLHAKANHAAVSSAPGVNPDGHLDSATRSGSSVRLVGWAHDGDNDPASLAVRGLVDGVVAGSGTANVSRSDVGPHGFDFLVPLDRNAHEVCAQAVNLGGGADTTLAGCISVPGTSATASFQVHHITADGVHINTCAGPSTSCPSVRTANTGNEVDVTCQLRGGAYSTASGTANVWDQLTDGSFAPDYWVDTKNTVFNGLDASLPGCSGTTAPSYQVHHATANGVHENSCAGPSTQCSTVRTVNTGDEVDVVCQTTGGSYSTPSGTANVWDKLVDSSYAPDYWVDTKNTAFNGFDSSIPRC